MTKQKKQDSPALQFIRLAWQSACTGVPHSWERFNQSVGEACRLAAETFLWHEGDMDALCGIKNHCYSILRCIGCGGLERMYAMAVKSDNMSYCIEYERYMSRPPIIADYVGMRRRSRIYVGCYFSWKGEKVTVTSFNNEGKAVACSYTTPQEKILHRYAISADDVKADRAERKRRCGKEGE